MGKAETATRRRGERTQALGSAHCICGEHTQALGSAHCICGEHTQALGSTSCICGACAQALGAAPSSFDCQGQRPRPSPVSTEVPDTVALHSPFAR